MLSLSLCLLSRNTVGGKTLKQKLCNWHDDRDIKTNNKHNVLVFLLTLVS